MNKYKKDESLSYGIGVFLVKSDDGAEMEIALPDKKEIKTGYGGCPKTLASARVFSYTKSPLK